MTAASVDVTLSVETLAILLDKARTAGWEQGAGYSSEERTQTYIRTVTGELAGVVLP